MLELAPQKQPCRAETSLASRGPSSMRTESTPSPAPRHPRVLHALHRQLVQLQLPGFQGFTLLKQRLVKGDTGWDLRCGPTGALPHQ